MVRPLSRVLVAYANGDKATQAVVNKTLADLGIPVGALFSLSATPKPSARPGCRSKGGVI